MKAPAFQFYADDFIGGTVCFTAEDVGAYMRLLCFQWGNGALPVRKELVDRIAGCVVSDDVMAKFPDGVNPRMEKERAKYAAYREQQANKGRASAEARRNHGSTTVQPEHQPKGNSPTPTPTPTPSSSSFQPAEPTAGQAPQVSDEPELTKKQKHEHNAELLLETLNEAAGKNFTPVKSHLDPIIARLKEKGVEPEECEKMILRQVRLWKNDPKMCGHLVPSTLFRASNFQKYYDTRDDEAGGVSQVNGKFNTHQRLMQ